VITTGLYEWYYTIGLRTSSQCLVALPEAIAAQNCGRIVNSLGLPVVRLQPDAFLVLLSGLFMAAGVIHAA
jgi:hypothetical protein